MQNELQAKKVARSLISSPLIKTAIYGESPNWGRILARIGSEKISENVINQSDICVQGIKIFSHGSPVIGFDSHQLKDKMKEDTISIAINFFSGDCCATAWGCDLTEKYVKINAEYIS